MKALSVGEKWEIHDFESLISDPEYYPDFREALAEVIVDPVKFQFSLARVLRGDTGEIISLHPYDYQVKYITDLSRSKILLKSRQIGFTTEEAFYRYWKGYTRAGHMTCFVHLREDNATKYIDIIGQLNRHIVPQLALKFRHDTTKMKWATNGSLWKIFSSNSVDAIRGFTGDVVFDEFSLVPNSEELLAGGGSAAVRGKYERSIGSTPKGINNAFYRLCSEAGWDVTKNLGSIAEYKEVEKTAMKLFKEGYFTGKTNKIMREKMYKFVDKKTRKIKRQDTKNFNDIYERALRNNFSMYSLHVAPWFICPDIDWSDIMQIGLDRVSLLQEYFLSFSVSGTSMLTEEEIDACMVEDMLLMPPNEAKHFVDRGVFMGIDPSLGKVNETAWYFVVEPIMDKNNLLIEPWRVLWHEVTRDPPLAKQMGEPEYVPRLMKQIQQYNPAMIYMDATGIGDTVVTALIRRGIAEKRIDAIQMRGKNNYEPIFYNLVSVIQSQLVMLPDDERLKDQLYSLEKTYTDTGKPHFSGKCNSSDGQDDKAVALALALCRGSSYNLSNYKMEEVDLGAMKTHKNDDYIGGKFVRYL